MALGSGAKVFVREATGLVRERGWLDLMFLNVVAFGGAWSIIFAFTYAPFYGGDPALSLLLTAPGILALLGVYYIFSTSMPRSGGDYVYVGRILHPALGLAANFVGVTLFLWFWIADGASLFSSQGLAQILSVYGALTKSSWAISTALWVAQPWNNFLLGTVVILLFTVFIIVNLRTYFRIQNIFMTVAVIGLAVIVILLVAALFNPAAFKAAFDSYSTSVGGNSTAYDQVANGAAGSAPDISPLGIATFQLIPLWFVVLFWVYYSNYLGGETRNVRSTAKRAYFGAFAIIFFATLLIFEIGYRALGFNFIVGANNIFYGSPNISTNAAPPNLTLFVSILANSPLLVLFLGIGIVAGFLFVVPNSIITFSRNLFAYSFDRLAPEKVAKVNDRFHAPVWAIAVAVVGSEVMLAFLSGVLGSGNSATALALFTWAGLGTVTATFLFVGIAAIVFPWRRKELYESVCTVKRKILGIPVISWLGLVAFVYSFVTIYEWTANQVFYTFGCPAGGPTGCLYNDFIYTLIGVFIATIAYYGIIRYVRSRKGIPIDLALKEIPPE
jgi:basic amino acid/polyamine antiporter, APA family